MELSNQLIFLAGSLFITSILATVITPRLGVPLLLIFLIVGMLAGEDGPGGVQFDDYGLASLAGTAALAVVLFDGGMRTSHASFRLAVAPAATLATVGVMLTTLLVGGFSAWMFDLSLAEGMLIGAIVGSTDAAAVFSLLHTSAVKLNERVTAALEIESGTNDPMAVFLTIALLQYLLAPTDYSFADSLLLLVQQMGLGALIGIAGGRGATFALNRLELSDSLYPLMALFSGFLIFGFTGLLGGSGFLAAYLAGMELGNRRVRGIAGIKRFHDGVAWMAQIGMFVILGLLASPRDLLQVAVPAMLIALVLMLAARPLAVLLCLLPFRFPMREQVFISWVGLRGSVPILLATYPLLAGVENAGLFFNVAFFIVLVSLVVQGWTIAPAAKLLGLNIPDSAALVRRVDFDLPGTRGYEIVSYRIGDSSPLIGMKSRQLPLDDISRIVCLARRGKIISYRDWGNLRAGDYISLLASQEELPKLDKLFQAQVRPQSAAEEQRFYGEFRIDPSAPADALAEAYGVPVPEAAKGRSVAAFFETVIPRPVIGDRLRLGEVELVVKRLDSDHVAEIWLRLPH
ncbi:potassium/proton antiporter [Panacagrimonas sp.]|uniref:potassium/proton antiporter n=1 Tax=Panacagrimonas sp. TaxID=2480088 RepID=UPI003B5291CF